ncbi:hypothetical protein NUU61_002876 [Penicillium alfredii]|uniref:RING-type E3 ubiquitin transferase n=1 Tax=Penicillium alfredii TaxID=1506179 RepID=A0A9W9FSI7_9EURO|nr:uncharacterized protein NUU61_002876 [Penicillium alfredii]KAJ5105529.1 hypothetical protein NUU61_002876 [Penicillium alfredii]
MEFSLLFLFLFLFSPVHGLTVLPSNNTHDLDWSQSVRFRLQASGPLNGLSLAPWSKSLAQFTQSQLRTFKVRGNLTKVDPADSVDLHNSQIACIICDPEDYPGEVTVDETVNNVIQSQQASAILLYSASSGHCNFSADDQTTARYPNIFTFVGSNATSALQHTFSDSDSDSVTIVSAMSFMSGSSGADTGDSGGSSNGPNTAMIILYSITGIITALFLGIIITGALRAHRHPERYGPRRVAGRPRQSRARGIARAMLDTLPIVKYGDNNDGVDPAKRDIEMSIGPEDPARDHSPPRSESVTGQTTPRETELPSKVVTENHTTTAASESRPEPVPDAGNFSCPICTDDFTKGQDLRVLPCNHQFHPDCIDPWLVNVSGTCPLCRIDLNPPKSEENAEPGENGEHGEHTEETQPDSTATPATDAQTGPHRRLTNYLHGSLNARRMRDASVEERLAAIRRVRAEIRDDAVTGDDATRPSRTRLTTRLRDRFRIRTRAHGVEEPSTDGENTPIPPAASTPAPTTAPASNEGESTPTTPAAPAATHTAGPPASNT